VAENIILVAPPPIFQFWGVISHIDENGTDFKVQTPVSVSVKQSTGEKTKRGRIVIAT